MKPKVGILSLGCPRNLVDSENILARLFRKGYSLVDIEDADIAIVNTCSFIKDATEESIDSILDLAELKKQGRLRKIIVAGCLPQRYKSQLVESLPEIDAFVGRLALNHYDNKYRLTPKHFAYVKICEGCINNCSFCVIPKIKGKLNSRNMDSILKELMLLDRKGISEINLIGQDISVYGWDIYRKPSLTALLKKITKNTRHINWIRLLYLSPEHIEDDLLKLMRDSAKICKYVDLPIQHINGRILKLMNRNITKKKIINLLERIRKIIPHAAIRTSLIVGFPSETEKEFKELLDFIKIIKFERLGAFAYSREEQTPAYYFKDQIALTTKKERLNRIMLAQQEVSRQINSSFLGKTIDVLIDESDRNSRFSYTGRSQFDAPEVDGTCIVKSKRKLSCGDFVKVRISDSLEYDLVGEAR